MKVHFYPSSYTILTIFYKLPILSLTDPESRVNCVNDRYTKPPSKDFGKIKNKGIHNLHGYIT